MAVHVYVYAYACTLLCASVHVQAAYSAAFGRDGDAMEEDGFSIPPVICEKLPGTCKCTTERTVLNDELQLIFSGTVVNCANRRIAEQVIEYFATMKRVLDEYPFRQPTVMRVDLGSNNIRSLKLSGPFSSFKIKILRLTDNPVAELRSLYFSHLNIEFLQLRQTELKKVTRVSNMGIRNLRALDLSSNDLNTIDSDAFTKTTIRFLNLSGNQNLQFTARMFTGLESYLETIDLSATNLRALPSAFQSFTKLRFFYLQYNQIAFIDATDTRLLPQLVNTVYHFEHNLIRWIDPDAFVRHEMPFILYADDNQISDMAFLYKHDPCVFTDVGVSVRQNDVYCGCSLLKFLAYNTLVVEGNCAFPTILHNLNFRHFERRSFLEELFKDPYFAAMEKKCQVEIAKNDSFVGCRCNQINVISQLLLHDDEVKNCRSGQSSLRHSRSASVIACAILFVFVFVFTLLRD